MSHFIPFYLREIFTVPTIRLAFNASDGTILEFRKKGARDFNELIQIFTKKKVTDRRCDLVTLCQKCTRRAPIRY